MPSNAEGKYTAEFLLSESPGSRSRENVTVLSGENLLVGHVLGRRLVSPTFGAAAALGTNVGNGVFGTVTAATNLGAQRGTYRIVMTEPTTNLGTFEVFDPSGLVVGDGVVGTAFDNQIQFTIADGGTDFVAGDAFTVAVTGGTYKVKEYDPADADGGQRPYGVLLSAVNATSADKAGVAVVRDAEVRSGDLSWFSGASATQKETAQDVLAAAGLIVRA